MLAIALPLGVLFGDDLTTDSSFALRDVAHFYHPLWKWCRSEWGEGRVPLWNPLDSGGSAVLADATSSVFYPGKLLFALPFSFEALLKAFIVGHVALAAAGAFCVARHWNRSLYAAALAAVAFSCGGSVAFQYCNPVFLVGAAWLPWSLLAVDELIQRQTWGSVWLLAVTLSLMILGGDPQMAVHVLLAAFLYSVIVVAASQQRDPTARRSPGLSLRRWLLAMIGRLSWLAAAFALAGALSAVQILPSREAANESVRAVYDEPRNVYEATEAAWRVSTTGEKLSHAIQRSGKGILGPPARGSHLSTVYDFSLGPWRLAELFFPNVFGRMFPIHHRWLNDLPAEGRTWSPTLYMGVLVALLALTQVRPLSADTKIRWLSRVLIVFALGSFGWYGLGWLVREIYATVFGGDSTNLGVGQPVGGVYWFLVTFLPGYVQFRYPAKLFTVASLSIALLAAYGWDDLLTRRATWFRRLGPGLAFVAGIGFVATWALAPWFLSHRWSNNSAFGPLEPQGALWDIRIAFLQTGLVVASCWLLLCIAPAKYRGLCAALALVITASDVAVANRWMIARASSEIWRAPSQAKELLAQDGAQSGEDGGSPRTIYRRGPLSALPESFERVSSSDRIAEICRWEHDTLRPKYPLLDHIGLAESSSSLPRADRETFWRVARRQGAEANLPHIAALRLAGVDYVLSPLSVNDGGRDESPDKEVRSAAVPLTSVLSPLPDAWVVHHVASLPPMAANASTAELERRTREVLFANGAPRDFLASAVVEATNPPRFSEPALSALPNGSCQVVERSPQRMRIEANLPRPGLLVVNLPYDGGWKARTPGSNAGPLAILRTNRILQGVALPAGTHTLELTYEPASFRVGAAVSLIAWLLLGAMMIGRVVKRFRSGS